MLVLALALVYRPLGDYMARSLESPRHSRVERGIYRVIGVDPGADQRWSVYLRSILAFSVVSILALYALLRLQAYLPVLAGAGGDAVPPGPQHGGQLRHQHELAVVLG